MKNPYEQQATSMSLISRRETHSELCPSVRVTNAECRHSYFTQSVFNHEPNTGKLNQVMIKRCSLTCSKNKKSIQQMLFDDNLQDITSMKVYLYA